MDCFVGAESEGVHAVLVAIALGHHDLELCTRDTLQVLDEAISYFVRFQKIAHITLNAFQDLVHSGINIVSYSLIAIKTSCFTLHLHKPIDALCDSLRKSINR